MPSYLLAIDQGTTSTRAIIFDATGKSVASAQQEITQYFPSNGWVEHNPKEIWESTLTVCRNALRNAQIDASQLAGIGMANQRETTIVWDRATGDAVYPAIVWQDRRTTAHCEQLRDQGHESRVMARTGLLLDPYFSATKIAWILDNVAGARLRAERGELAFGTVDSWLLWHLTGGLHATDATNASRTALFNIHEQRWDTDIMALFGIPATLLPEVKDSAADFGHSIKGWLGAEVPICGVAGDQQAALFGQACFSNGMAKSTYGTGCFLMLNTGEKPIQSDNRLLTTVGFRLNGVTTYAMEGSIFVAGAAVQWLRDGLKLINSAQDSEVMASKVGADNSVYLVPAFTGLGAPYWNPRARGAIMGLTRDTGIAEIVTAGLQSVCYQTKDLLQAAVNDGATISELRVDGGMSINNWVMQFLSDILNVSVDRPQITETTALGAAYLAGLQAGVFQDIDQISQQWQRNRRFTPNMSSSQRDRSYHGWLDAVKSVLHNR